VISFRSHVVSLIAVFLALAIGVVLGGGPLSEVGRGATADELASAQGDARQARDDARKATAYADQFALETANRTLAHGLNGQTVVVLTMPGASSDQVAGIAGLVKTAGGTVVGNYALQRTLFAHDQESLVDSLGSQLAGMVHDSTATGMAAYQRAGRLLGDAVATTTAAGAAFDDNAVSAREGLEGADLVAASGNPVQRGGVVVVVLGDEPPADTDADTLLAAFTAGLKTTTRGIVVAGSFASGSSGLLGALRGNDGLSEGVSTVDSVESRPGQVDAVMALIAVSAGTAGSYGASGSDGAVALR
jgi:hypothetical protein